MKKSIAIFVIMAALVAFADNPHVTRLIELIDVAILSPADGDVLTFDAASSKWTNKQPATPDGPQVVARFQVVDSTSDLANTVIFTPVESGMYRLNVYQETRLEISSPCPTAFFSWSDEYSSQPITPSSPFACGSGSGGFAFQFSNILRTPGPISVSVSNPSGVTFSIYITVEKL